MHRTLAAVAAIVAAMPATAQISSATVRGNVTAQGEPQPGASVAATNIANGYVTRTLSGADGNYVLPALPPGSYRIVVSAEGQAPTAQLLTVQVGQNVSLNLTLEPLVPAAETAAAAADTVVVSSIRDTRTSEVGTNITQKQINTLPQGTRNFLAFADLVPGVAFETLGDGSTRLRGGAMSAAGINVYIDGVGQKNYVLQGGITGQDSSRGNVFPQSAIAEYKVITQNYKAEYDQVSSVGIAAVTRSGTNTFRGEAFWDHSTAAWRAPTPAERRAGRKSPSNDDQFGLAMGGAIVPDRAHWFFAYEGKNIDSPKTVTLGQGRSEAELPAALRGLAGPVGAPFTEHLLFAKLDASLDDYNLFELAFKLRRETETTGVGGTESLPYGTYKKNDETRFDLRWQRSAPTWVNDARVTYEDAGFSPRARTLAPGYLLTTADPGQVILRGGGGRDFQNKGQKGPALQNDFTFTGLEWAGSHVIKLGAKLKWVTVDAQEQNPFNPQFFYDIGQNTGQPYKVQFGAPLAGIGDGRARSRNTQVGLYVQDDWEVNNNFTLNLGLRWDYERSPGYLDYVTPPAVVAALRSAGGVNAHGSGVNIEDFIATGNSRRTFTRAWQPRAGLSFDLNADQRHVIYGGYARAYDRNLFDYLQLERTKETFSQYEFQFDTAAHPCAGDTCLAWNPAYLDPAVLVALANGQGTGRELDLLSNKLKTPHSDQFSVGMRNSIGDWNTEVALSRVQSKDGLVFLLGNRRPDGSFFVPGASWNPPYGSPVPGFGSLLLGTNGLATRSHSLLLKADKPYDPASGWAAGVAYTYTNAKENRQFGEHYALDYPNLEAYGWKQAGGVSRHRLVATGIVDGPRDSVFSVRLTLATHAPRYGTNCLASPADNSGCFIDQLKPRGNRFLIGGPMWGYRQLDVAVSKAFRVPGGTLRLRADLINVLNAKNYDGYDTWWGTNNVPNANFGQPDGSLKGPTRTLKLGLAYAW